MKKKKSFIFQLLLLMLLSTGCASSLHDKTFSAASKYWFGLNQPGEIEAEVLVELMKPLFNSEGINYVIEKMERGTETESQIAVLLLVPMHQTLIQASVNDENILVLQRKIESSSLKKKVAEFAGTGRNMAIRMALKKFIDEDANNFSIGDDSAEDDKR